jgi:hypothetical protein
MASVLIIALFTAEGVVAKRVELFFAIEGGTWSIRFSDLGT